MKTQLFLATEKDIPTIQSLAHAIWQEHYPSIIGQEQVDYMLNKLYSNAALQAQMQDGQSFYLVKHDADICGFIAVSMLQKNHYFIHKFYISTQLHNRGIGSQAFVALRKLFEPESQFSLQVNRQNHKPINFYFKHGFIIERVADFDIGDGYFMNDFIMVRKPITE